AQAPNSAKKEQPKPDDPKQPRLDRYGDPLPEGAIARLGTMRFRHGNTMYRAALSADGNRLATTGGHSVTHIWDLTTGKSVRQFQPQYCNDAVAFSPKGNLIAIGGMGGVYLYDVARGKQVRHIESLGSVFALDFAIDGKTLAIGSLEGSLCIYDAETG